jgi:hypothetical protein
MNDRDWIALSLTLIMVCGVVLFVAVGGCG